MDAPTTQRGLFLEKLDANAAESLRLLREIVDAVQRTFPPSSGPRSHS